MFHRLTHRHSALQRQGVGCLALCTNRITKSRAVRFYTEPMLTLLEQGVEVKGVSLPHELLEELTAARNHQEAMAFLYRHQLI